MPVIKCGNGKWRIGNGPCMYTSEEKANRAYQAYLAKRSKKKNKMGAKGYTEPETAQTPIAS